MATSRSVAETVSAFSRAESLTHWRAGLGVRLATTLPATVRAACRAPRLQITFMMTCAFRSWTNGPARGGERLPVSPVGWPLARGRTTLQSLDDYKKT